ncbi:MAG: 16S rRNA (guanine(527)-N(7))-methyltransferase RsmG [Nitrospinota bacterium]
MTVPSLSATLRREIQRAQLAVERGKEAKLAAYLSELARWNERTPLTALETDMERVTVLVVQSLQMARALPPSRELMVLDIGGGNGAPGLVLAVVHPYWRLDLLEANRRKATFLKHMARSLGLANVKALFGRAEKLAEEVSYRWAYDAVVSRATAKLGYLIAMADPFLAPGGRLVTLKGRHWEDELAAGLPPALQSRYTVEEAGRLAGPPGGRIMTVVVAKRGA